MSVWTTGPPLSTTWRESDRVKWERALTNTPRSSGPVFGVHFTPPQVQGTSCGGPKGRRSPARGETLVVTHNFAPKWVALV
jgi:hypothetical protein